jgi:hypothetical protein
MPSTAFSFENTERSALSRGASVSDLLIPGDTAMATIFDRWNIGFTTGTALVPSLVGGAGSQLWRDELVALRAALVLGLSNALKFCFGRGMLYVNSLNFIFRFESWEDDLFRYLIMIIMRWNESISCVRFAYGEQEKHTGRNVLDGLGEGVEEFLGLHVVWREEQRAFARQDVMVRIHEQVDRFVSLKEAVDSLQGFFWPGWVLGWLAERSIGLGGEWPYRIM